MTINTMPKTRQESLALQMPNKIKSKLYFEKKFESHEFNSEIMAMKNFVVAMITVSVLRISYNKGSEGNILVGKVQIILEFYIKRVLIL